MRDLFKILGKKKGARQSGSRPWAVATAVAFAMVLISTALVITTAVPIIQWTQSTPGHWFYSVFDLSIWGVVIVGLFAIGLTQLLSILWHVGASAERRGAIVSRARDVELFNQVANAQRFVPHIPLDQKQFAVWGQRLKFRIPARGATRWSVLSIGGLTALFVLISTALIVLVSDSTRRNGVDWIGVVLSAALSLVTIWLVWQFFRHLLMQTAIGPTELEISDVPIAAGHSYQLFISQPARMRIRLLDLVLECEEQATFRQGTDIRTETRVVYGQRLFRRRGIDVERRQPFQAAFELDVPSHAMHSFRASNNSVVWRIRLTSEVKGWPAVHRYFPLVVVPERFPDLVA